MYSTAAKGQCFMEPLPFFVACNRTLSFYIYCSVHHNIPLK